MRPADGIVAFDALIEQLMSVEPHSKARRGSEATVRHTAALSAKGEQTHDAGGLLSFVRGGSDDDVVQHFRIAEAESP